MALIQWIARVTALHEALEFLHLGGVQSNQQQQFNESRNSLRGVWSGSVRQRMKGKAMHNDTRPSVPPKLADFSATAADTNRDPKLNRATLSAFCAALFFFGVAVLVVGFYGSPRHSIKQFSLAVQRHDKDGILMYLEPDPFAASIRFAALESVREQMAKDTNDDIASAFGNAAGEKIATMLVNELVTGDSITAVLCGHPPQVVMKDS
jgi:hypothetical protein